MKIYWINLEVKFVDEMPIFNDDERNPNDSSAKGFIQEMGCTANHENEMQLIVENHLKSLEWLDISNSEIIFRRIGEILPDEIDSEIYGDSDIREALRADPNKIGIWYLSGCAFYIDDEDDNELSVVEPKRI